MLRAIVVTCLLTLFAIGDFEANAAQNSQSGTSLNRPKVQAQLVKRRRRSYGGSYGSSRNRGVNSNAYTASQAAAMRQAAAAAQISGS